jgi:hypothetical protein
MLPITDWAGDFAALEAFLREWHGPVAASRGCRRAPSQGTQLPLVLELFYESCGFQLADVIGYHRFTAREYLVPTWPLVFCQEAEGLYEWGAEDASPNPRVLGHDCGCSPRWFPEEDRLCRYLRALCIHDAIICAPFGASASWLTQSELRAVLAEWKPLDLAPLRWPAYPTQLYGTRAAFGVVTPNRNAFTFTCGARHANELAFVERHVDNNWEYVHLQ